MLGVLALSLMLTQGSVRAQPQDALALLSEGRYLAALEACRTEPDELQGNALRARVLLEGRDFRGAQLATESALAMAPGDLHLLWQMAHISLWMRAGGMAMGAVAQLEDALEGAGLDAPERTQWETRTREYREQAQVLVEAEESALVAERRARIGSLFGLGSALLALLFLARPSQHVVSGDG